MVPDLEFSVHSQLAPFVFVLVVRLYVHGGEEMAEQSQSPEGQELKGRKEETKVQ